MSETTSAEAGRDAKGRFAKGNPGGKGNPFARRVAALRKAMLDTVTDEDIAAINAKMIEKARQGDVAAARLVYSYAIGKPQAAEDPDRMDEKEWEQWKREAVSGPDVIAVANAASSSLACVIARSVVPGMQDVHVGEILEGLHQSEERDREEAEEAEREAAQQKAQERAAKKTVKAEGAAKEKAEVKQTEAERTSGAKEEAAKGSKPEAGVEEAVIGRILGKEGHEAEASRRAANGKQACIGSEQASAARRDERETTGGGTSANTVNRPG